MRRDGGDGLGAAVEEVVVALVGVVEIVGDGSLVANEVVRGVVDAEGLSPWEMPEFGEDGSGLVKLVAEPFQWVKK